MTRTPKTCFVYKVGHLGSARIRGIQVAKALGCNSFLLKEFTLEQAAAHEVVVYVKRMPAPSLMKAIRRRGIIQVVDPLDDYNDWRMRRRVRYIDALIGASLTHAVHLERKWKRPTTELPHHHCNFDERRIPPARLPPTLGYVGGKLHWPETRSVLKKFSYPTVVDLEHRNLVDSYMAIDVGLGFRKHAQKTSFNSPIKLLNYMSFGIPAVVTPESGYLEVARHGEHCLFAQTKAEYRMLLARLAEDLPLRQKLGDAAWEAARPFHMRCVAERYHTFLRSL